MTYKEEWKDFIQRELITSSFKTESELKECYEKAFETNKSVVEVLIEYELSNLLQAEFTIMIKKDSVVVNYSKSNTITDLDYTFMVRAEEEAYESIETRNAIRRNVAIYIKNENIDSKISLVMIKHPHEEVKFYFNQDDSFYNFDWVERNLTKLIEFIFYGIEP